ncbi:MAG: M15 family metallopeptidase [Desulfobacterales bacterium]|nr:M15 family metallopeptidase [Desulfobacterales bacterium]MCP4163907.1 M15 family metallopeptidase [Deltaproteobacteria bacterium]
MRYVKNTLLIIFVLFIQSFVYATDQDKSSFVSITDMIPDVVLDIRYFTEYNFVGEKIDGYKAPKCLLSKKAANALKKVQDELRKKGLSLLIYDCYRPQQAVDHFVRWAEDLDNDKMQEQFYPGLKKKSLFVLGYIAKKSGHSRGSSIDLSITKIPFKAKKNSRTDYRECDCNQDKRHIDGSLDMGTGYDCFNTLSHTLNSKIETEQMNNRLLLKKVMEKHGFRNYSKEWWHFSLKNEPYRKRYFNFQVE